jgi:hypothetical protein
VSIAKDRLTSANQGNVICTPQEERHLQGIVEDQRKKLLLAQKKQLIDEKNQILVKKNQIVAEKKQIVDKEQQQPETQVNDMKMLSQNKDLED